MPKAKVSSNRDDMAMGGNQWNQWYPAETEILIKIWGEASASGELDGTMRNQFVHIEIAKKLAEAGFNRTTSGIQNRIKYLKRTYAKARKLVQSGQARRKVPHRPQFYKELDRILGDDPFWGTHAGGHGETSGDNPGVDEHETSEDASSSNPTSRGGLVSSDTLSPRETDHDNLVSVNVHISEEEEEEEEEDDDTWSARGETVIIKEEPDVEYEMIDQEPMPSIFRPTTTTINPQPRSNSPSLASQTSRNANEMHNMPVIESVYGATTMPTSLTTAAAANCKEQELAELKAKLVTEQHRAKMALIRLKQDAARAKLESARAKRSAYDEKRMFYFEKRKMLHTDVDQM